MARVAGLGVLEEMQAGGKAEKEESKGKGVGAG